MRILARGNIYYWLEIFIIPKFHTLLILFETMHHGFYIWKRTLYNTGDSAFFLWIVIPFSSL